jgi:hypothetical protein
MQQGYFGIGGAFLAMPMLMHPAGLNIMQAIDISLLSVSMFGFSTTSRYYIVGYVVVTITVIHYNSMREDIYYHLKMVCCVFNFICRLGLSSPDFEVF